MDWRSIVAWLPEWATVGAGLVGAYQGITRLYRRLGGARPGDPPAAPKTAFWVKFAAWLRAVEKAQRLAGEVVYLEGELGIVKAQLAAARASGPASGSGSTLAPDGTQTRTPTSHASRGSGPASTRSARSSLTPPLSRDSAGRRRRRGRPVLPGRTPSSTPTPG